MRSRDDFVIAVTGRAPTAAAAPKIMESHSAPRSERQD